LLVTAAPDEEDPRLSVPFESDVRTTLYQIHRAKQVIQQLSDKVRAELDDQQKLDRFYDEAMER